MEFIPFEKGGVYPGALPQTDTLLAEFCRQGHHLLLAMEDISPEEMEVYHRPDKAGLLYSNGVILTFWRFPKASSPWLDAPFDSRLIPPEQYTPLEIISSESRMQVQYTLVDRRTRIVLALRLFTLDPTFTRFFARAVDWQRGKDREAGFGIELARLYQQDTDALARRADYVGRVGE